MPSVCLFVYSVPEIPPINYESNPETSCGCVVHLIRPGCRHVCCKKEINVENLRTCSKRMFRFLRETKFSLILKIADNVGVPMNDNIPQNVMNKVLELHRPLNIVILLPKENLFSAHYDTVLRKKKTRDEKLLLRKLAIVNVYSKNYASENENDDVLNDA